jgi:hypothetical protein
MWGIVLCAGMPSVGKTAFLMMQCGKNSVKSQAENATNKECGRMFPNEG